MRIIKSDFYVKGILSANARLCTLIVCFIFLFSYSGKAQVPAYTPLYTSSDFTRTIELSRPVGFTEGEASVTPSGAATYVIPIYTPPGTNGMQPSISIVYNSQASNGIAGIGWNISGLSIISRAGKDMYHDGIVTAANYTFNDAFMLDGRRLNPITGSNGADGTIYAEEEESFSKIISYTSGSSNNPDWFLVTAKDGTVMEYGRTTNSRIKSDNNASVMMWRLNKIIDVSGNYVEFKYSTDNGDSEIFEINYTGNETTSLLPCSKVRFIYTGRTDEITGYDAAAVGSM